MIFRLILEGEMRFIRLTILFILLVAGSLSISQIKQAQTGSEELSEWILALKRNPGDTQALRNIGVYCFENGKLPIAAKCWVLVYKQNPSDPQALYFLGRLLESKKRNDLALKFYQKFSQMPKTSPYRDAAEGRYLLLSRKQTRADVQALLDQENQLSREPASPKTVAVFPFRYQGNNPTISPIGKGLAEMLMTDLSQIRDIQVVERLRVQALLDETRLGQTGMVKEGSAPAFGKMLKAGKMVYGNFTLQDKNKLALDVSYMDVNQNMQSDPMNLRDALSNLFLLEKDIAFKVIDQMGVELTPQERERIQRIPTKSLMAFASYCMGLEMQDRGEFGKATEFFQKAVQLDPGYSSAKQKINENRLLISAQSNILPTVQPESVQLESQDRLFPDPAQLIVDQQSLINNRLKTVNINIGSNFKPGIETRKATQEAAESGANIGVTDLPRPPEPPSYQVP